MKFHLIAGVFLSSFAALAVACGLPAADDAAPDDSAVGEAGAALMTIRCLATDDCHPDEHAISYSCKWQCGSTSCLAGSPDSNAVICDTNTGGSFRQCGLDCPGGYHNKGNYKSSGCLPNDGGFNQANCETNDLTSFFTCEQECPTGFVVSSRVCRWECGTGCESGNNAVWCKRAYQ